MFPDTTVWYEASALNSFTIVTGRREAQARPWDATGVARVLAAPGVAAALADLGIRGPADVVACYLAGPPELEGWLAGVPPHVDDLPLVEYESGTLLERDRTWLATYSALLALRPAEPPAALIDGLDPAERERARRVWAERLPVLEAHRDFLAAQILGARRPVPP